MPTLSKDSISHLMGIISNPTYLAMARANVLTKDSYNSYDNWSANHWEKNSQLFEEVHSATRDINSCYYRTCIDAAYEIEARFGYIEALYFVEMLKKSSFNQFTFDYNRYSYQYLEKNNMRGFFQLLDEPYNLELRALIDYTFIDSYAQGITKITVEFWQTYESYLKMQIQIFGEVRDKYPRYLMTAHDTTALNIGLLENMPSDDNFKELTTEVRSLAHEDKEYSIVVPATARQIAEEGIVLNHCLGANAGQIASGDLHILFLRNSNAKEQPLVTLRYSNDKITAAEGLHRRRLTTNERKFLEHWGKEKDVQIAA